MSDANASQIHLFFFGAVEPWGPGELSRARWPPTKTIRFWGGGIGVWMIFFGKNGWFETGKITIFMLQTFFLTMWQWKIAGGEWEDFSYYKMIHHYVLYIYNNLGCGFNFIFIFIPTCGRWNQSDEHIFQMGWKHQLVIYYVYILFFTLITLFDLFFWPRRLEWLSCVSDHHLTGENNQKSASRSACPENAPVEEQRRWVGRGEAKDEDGIAICCRVLSARNLLPVILFISLSGWLFVWKVAHYSMVVNIWKLF